MQFDDIFRRDTVLTFISTWSENVDFNSRARHRI